MGEFGRDERWGDGRRGGRKEFRAHLGGSDSDLGTSVDVNSTVRLSGYGGSDCSRKKRR